MCLFPPSEREKTDLLSMLLGDSCFHYYRHLDSWMPPLTPFSFVLETETQQLRDIHVYLRFTDET